jgi:hypothetical protein
MRVAALAGLLIAGSACDTSVHSIALGPLDASPACEEAKAHDDLAWIQDKIFTKSCSLSNACHKGSAIEAAGLSLEAGKSYDQLVGSDGKGVAAESDVAKLASPPWTRVVPSDPAHSYLMVAIDPKHNPSPNGPTDPNGFEGPLDPKVGSMPVNNALLCTEKRDAIRRWIEQGAHDVANVDAGVPVIDAQ